MAGIGLTPDEVSGVKRTWKLVAQDLKGNGLGVMMALFTNYPEYKQFFKKLRDIPNEELTSNVNLRAHALTFMHGLAGFVESLENTDELVGLLHANAERHYPRNVRIEQYKNTVNLVPGFLKEKLGSEMDDTATSGWQKVIDAMVSVIGEKLSKIESEQSGTSID